MYMPSPNFHGNDSFYFNAKDRSNAESNTAVANITILPVPDPPYPLSDEIQTDEDTPKIFVLRANYYDNLSSPNNSISIMSLPNKGQLFYTQNMSSNSQDWMPVTEVPLTLPVSTGIVFVPMPDDNGVPYTRFTFAATDMILNSTVNATVTINVVPRNGRYLISLYSGFLECLTDDLH
ncbi:hypothetical protein BKA69DRAFT_890917 [Paraphysoderma sedebokerense]|nr:hypothetical protein BKA69DRAFT_890917 [Paraphysoderma sedebokerense]